MKRAHLRKTQQESDFANGQPPFGQVPNGEFTSYFSQTF
jgi:hypothetical protein